MRSFDAGERSAFAKAKLLLEFERVGILALAVGFQGSVKIPVSVVVKNLVTAILVTLLSKSGYCGSQNPV